jgi:putative ABC transport system permease protein
MHKTKPLGDVIGQSSAQRLFTLRILASFAAVALALAALGLFGVLSYAVRLRTREFGIRMALGAERGAIRRMVLREGLTVAGIGLVIGLLGAAAMSRVMTAAVFRTSPLDPVVLGAVAVFILVVGSLAALLPAQHATSVDPRTALQ